MSLLDKRLIGTLCPNFPHRLIIMSLPSSSASNLNPNTLTQYQAFSVLVVDDELGMQAILKKALGKFFGKVSSAGSVEEAETLRSSEHFDLIVLDINLPGRSGI